MKHGQAFEEVEEKVAWKLVLEDSATDVDRSTVLRQCCPDGHRRNVLNGICKHSERNVFFVS